MPSQSIEQLLQVSTPSVMGILNVTPDSFADQGMYSSSINTALGHARQMIESGADIIDVGGESTRPGSAAVPEQQELDRVIPVIEQIRKKFDILISVDTSKPRVMQEAVRAGAQMINDVNALRSEGAVEIASSLAVPVCLMHMQGNPQTMQLNPVYQNIVEEVKSFLLSRAEVCIQAGIHPSRILFDPGFGFGKTLKHNLSLLNQLMVLVETGYPVLVGLSRKSMIGQILDQNTAAAVDQRLYGSLSAALFAVSKGAEIVRVHDVRETVDVIKIYKAIMQAV